MIERKDLPSEYVSIRQVWLRQINRCNEAMSHRFMMDVKDDRSESSGSQMVVESVVALYTNLIDYGEATIRSDVDAWKSNVMSKMKNPSSFVAYRKLFEYIIQTLNKYGMLFESQPRGYSNVEMKSV
ncbi:MAG: hypothetical protein JSW60_07365 [Thermoplasmatales archaeon]|nr:MAG: hypothetical protein JSW60_07365 [Thermoplasmatales archaeon]